MLALARIIIFSIYIAIVSIFGVIFCLFRPFNPNNTPLFAHLYGRAHRIFGLKLDIRAPNHINHGDHAHGGPFVYIANHQNTWDIFTLSRAMPFNAVSIGKKSLKWIPFFGQLYWLAGNILIDRKNSGRARGTIAQAADAIKQRGISILLFPEGTRSNGRGLLPFKTGAFRTAVQAQVPLVLICVSDLHDKIRLNRWNNGTLIIEYLPPLDVSQYDGDSVKQLVEHCHELMKQKIESLNAELKESK